MSSTTLKVIDRMSRAAFYIAGAMLLIGFRVWGDDYSHANRTMAESKAEQERAITAAIEFSSQEALIRDRQMHEVLLLSVQRMDSLREELIHLRQEVASLKAPLESE